MPLEAKCSILDQSGKIILQNAAYAKDDDVIGVDVPGFPGKMLIATMGQSLELKKGEWVQHSTLTSKNDLYPENTVHSHQYPPRDLQLVQVAPLQGREDLLVWFTAQWVEQPST